MPAVQFLMPAVQFLMPAVQFLMLLPTVLKELYNPMMMIFLVIHKILISCDNFYFLM